MKTEVIHKTGKLNLGFVIWTLRGMGGSERVVYDIVRKLDKSRYKIILISFEDGPVRAEYNKLGVRTHVIFKRHRFDLGFFKEFRKILREEDVDILNPHHFTPLFNTFVATRRTNIRIIYTEHSRWQHEELGFFSGMLGKYMMRHVEGLVAISRQIEDYYINYVNINRRQVYFIPNGIDLDIYRKKKSEGLRKQIGLRGEEKVIGMVANLRPEKNHKLLISAFSRLTEKLGNVHLVLVGLDCMEGEIQRFVLRKGLKGKVLFLGSRKDVPELLSTFDVFCLPSIHEGMPLTLLEAMASGVPVVGADVLGINELIKNNVNGLLFPSNSEDKLVEAILKLLSNKELAGSFSDAGRLFVEQNYCLDDKIKRYDRLFGHLQEESSRNPLSPVAGR